MREATGEPLPPIPGCILNTDDLAAGGSIENAISLRDQVAAQVLKSLMSKHLFGPEDADVVCRVCYTWADAMLKASLK